MRWVAGNSLSFVARFVPERQNVEPTASGVNATNLVINMHTQGRYFSDLKEIISTQYFRFF
jgi:hypothetical protein